MSCTFPFFLTEDPLHYGDIEFNIDHSNDDPESDDPSERGSDDGMSL